MDQEVKKSVFELVKDALIIAIKVKLGLYSKNPLGAVTDLKDVVEDAKELKNDIKDKE
jgi:hypothetical protein